MCGFCGWTDCAPSGAGQKLCKHIHSRNEFLMMIIFSCLQSSRASQPRSLGHGRIMLHAWHFIRALAALLLSELHDVVVLIWRQDTDERHHSLHEPAPSGAHAVC